MTSHNRTYDPSDRAQVFNALRSQILAARLKVTLDKKQKRVTPPTVKRLAMLELPPIVEPSGYFEAVDPKHAASQSHQKYASH